MVGLWPPIERTDRCKDFSIFLTGICLEAGAGDMLGALRNRIEKIVFEKCNDSKRQFAELLGVEHNTIDLWDDDHIPQGDILQRIHELLNVDLHWLLTGKGDSYTSYSDVDPSRQQTIEVGQTMELLCRASVAGNQAISQVFYLMEEGDNFLRDRINRLERTHDELRNKVEEIYECFKTKQKKEMPQGNGKWLGTLYIEFLPPPNYKLLFVNNPFSEALGQGSSRIVGNPFLSFIEPSYRAAFKRHIGSVMDCRLPSFFPIEICSGDKPPVSCRAIHIPVLDRAGSITKIAGYGHITCSSSKGVARCHTPRLS